MPEKRAVGSLAHLHVDPEGLVERTLAYKLSAARPSVLHNLEDCIYWNALDLIAPRIPVRHRSQNARKRVQSPQLDMRLKDCKSVQLLPDQED